MFHFIFASFIAPFEFLSLSTKYNSPFSFVNLLSVAPFVSTFFHRLSLPPTIRPSFNSILPPLFYLHSFLPHFVPFSLAPSHPYIFPFSQILLLLFPSSTLFIHLSHSHFLFPSSFRTIFSPEESLGVRERTK